MWGQFENEKLKETYKLGIKLKRRNFRNQEEVN
jgi:hypothetical protein